MQAGTDFWTTVERRNLIVGKLENQGEVYVDDLSKEFNVSTVTIRNDLAYLEKKGVLMRSRGGAMKQSKVAFEFAISEKQKHNSPEKELIGKKASEFIEDRDTIILDSGSTTMEVARNLNNFRDLTVITNALNIAWHLKDSTNLKVIIPGGILKPQSFSLFGSLAEEGFRNYYCDKLFLGVDGIDLNYGLTTPNVEEAHLNRLMIDISRHIIVVTDSSKFFKRSFAFIAPVNRIHTIITDNGIQPEVKKSLENIGIQVIVV